MKDRLIKLLTSPVPRLVFALICGSAYFILVSAAAWEMARNMTLILFYVAPIIICGGALILVKLIKRAEEAENERIILRIFGIHTVVILLAVVYAVDMLLI